MRSTEAPDRVALDRLRDRALAQVEIMREARSSRLDPGGGAIDEAAVLVGGGRRGRLIDATLPGHVAGCFVTAPVEVRAAGDLLHGTL